MTNGKKMIMLLICTSIIIICCVLRWATTRDNYVYRELLSLLKQIEHGSMIDHMELSINRSSPGCFLTASLMDGLSGEQIEQVCQELRTSMDHLIYYGSTGPLTPHPGEIVLVATALASDGAMEGMTCTRRIEFEDGSPKYFYWSIRNPSGEYESVYSPYIHPFP